jgi:hypothetical protein
MNKTAFTNNLISVLARNTEATHRMLCWPGSIEMQQFAARIWQEAFKRGYERGKSDERDAKEIDDSLADDGVS